MGLSAPATSQPKLLLFPARKVAQYSQPIGTLWSCLILASANTGDAES